MRNRIGAAALLIGAMAVTGCGETEGAEAQPSSENGGAERTVNVEVMQVEAAPFTHFVRVVGTVEAQHDVMVSAEEGGVVESIGAAKGERVRPGDPLIRLDADVLRAQLEQATSQAALAEETWERQRRLWEQDSIGTEIAYLQAKYNAETARAQARVLRERVERKVVRAPIAGVLDDRMVEVGSMVAPGAPVARVLDLDTVEIVAGVPERYAGDIEEGAEVEVEVKSLGDRRYTGSIDFVGAAVDGGNRTFQVEVLVPNPGLGIKPGMVADVQIARRTIEGAVAVPRHAVLRRENGYVVYVARPSGDSWVAEARTVTPGVTRGERVVIEAGLESGERVVTVGQQRVAEGDAIRITNEQTLPPPPAEYRDTVGTGGEETDG